MLSGTMLVDDIHTPKHRMHVHEKKEVAEEGDVRIDSSIKVQRASIKVGGIFVRPKMASGGWETDSTVRPN
jgi:hypothetical protein